MSELVRRVAIAGSGTEIEAAYRKLVRALGTGPLDEAAFDPAKYPASAVEEARRFWHARMEAEHRSVAVFLLLGAQLIEANTTLDAKAVMLGMAQDELRHTEICGQVLRALGSEPASTMDVEVRPLATHAGATLEERALRNVIYACCLSEMVALARLTDALEHTTDPLARAATRAVLADEVMHGRFGFLYLEAHRDLLAGDAALRDSLATYLRHAFAVLERELAGPGAGATARPSPEAMSLGVIDPARAGDVFYNTVEHAIVPGLEQHGIAAATAWRDRRDRGYDPGAQAPENVGVSERNVKT